MSLDLVYLALKWVHVVAAGVVLGLLVVLPMVPVRPPTDGAERATTEHVLRFLKRGTDWLLLPAILVLLATGTLMTVGPWAKWDLLAADGRWVLLGMGLWMVLAGVIVGFMGGLVKEMLSLTPRGEGAALRLDDVWRQYRWGVLASIVVTLATYWVMVFQPAW